MNARANGVYRGKRLYRRPDEGMIRGVCAGVACYLDVPVRLVRIITVLSMIFGLFMPTVLVYLALAWWLEPAPGDTPTPSRMTAGQQLDMLEGRLREDERQLRQIERYVTSDAFGLRNRFRQL
ncbi:envelope stress response membrane protein PspC [Martelella alba]|uniref:Envelope stress response membrane protein PspC n=1 Tax=Martelella alba TaxID=2590451 RepID=A0ABY2SRJ1_9HYPH|nr:envelope stress response membrane protein PspC [Martelella alba]TKI08095.1 envelope stress response membrane protein PspC [Martelella alba]